MKSLANDSLLPCYMNEKDSPKMAISHLRFVENEESIKVDVNVSLVVYVPIAWQSCISARTCASYLKLLKCPSALPQ